jgi:hypothetical protein
MAATALGSLPAIRAWAPACSRCSGHLCCAQGIVQEGMIQTMKPRRYTAAWIGWLAITAGGFAALEGYALRHGEYENTLSVHTRRVIGIHPRKPWHPVGRMAIVCAAAWTVNHIAFGPHSDSPLHRAMIDRMVRKAAS